MKHESQSPKPKNLKQFLKKIWNFLWHEESAASWIANIILAFVIIKFIVYPLLGLVLGTSFPVVAVISESMEHGLHEGQICGQVYDQLPNNFDTWWNICGSWYTDSKNLENTITKEQFEEFPFKNGFNKGDIMLLWRANSNNLELGDILIFQGPKSQPIIHRIVKITTETTTGTTNNDENNPEKLTYYYQTKGDHNSASFTGYLGEDKITEDRIYGKAIFRVPYLGYIKVFFADFLSLFGIQVN